MVITKWDLIQIYFNFATVYTTLRNLLAFMNIFINVLLTGQ